MLYTLLIARSYPKAVVTLRKVGFAVGKHVFFVFSNLLESQVLKTFKTWSKQSPRCSNGATRCFYQVDGFWVVDTKTTQSKYVLKPSHPTASHLKWPKWKEKLFPISVPHTFENSNGLALWKRQRGATPMPGPSGWVLGDVFFLHASIWSGRPHRSALPASIPSPTFSWKCLAYPLFGPRNFFLLTCLPFVSLGRTQQLQCSAEKNHTEFTYGGWFHFQPNEWRFFLAEIFSQNPVRQHNEEMTGKNLIGDVFRGTHFFFPIQKS